MKQSALLWLTMGALSGGGCGTHTPIGDLDASVGGLGGAGEGGSGGSGGPPLVDAGPSESVIIGSGGTIDGGSCGAGLGGRPGNQPPRTLSFLDPVDYPTGGGAYGVAQGDLTGDGQPDLVVLDNPVGVRVLANQGGGRFGPPVNHPVIPPVGIVIGDVTGDGRADIVGVNPAGVTVQVNLGAATFAPPVNYVAGVASQAVALGDLNGDGRNDIAVANRGGDVAVLFNTGNGTFSAAHFAASMSPSSIAIGDVNGDCTPDLITGDLDAGGLGVLINRGDGTFRPSVSYAVGIRPSSIAIGDLNGDGKADLAATGYYDDRVYVLLNYGNGTFTAAVSYPIDVPQEIDGGNGSFVSSLVIGDLDGDGIGDLAAASGCCGLAVSVNHGDGTFPRPVNYPTQPSAASVALADFDGDGKSDLAVVSIDYQGASLLSVRINSSH